VTLYTLQKSVVDGQFVKAVSLEGHEDWIRSLAFAKFSDSELCLASCAQDRYTRLWTITSKQLQEGQRATPTIAELLESMNS